MAQAIVASPYIVNAFIAGYITEDITLEGWRWGYGMCEPSAMMIRPSPGWR